MEEREVNSKVTQVGSGSTSMYYCVGRAHCATNYRPKETKFPTRFRLGVLHVSPTFIRQACHQLGRSLENQAVLNSQFAF